MVSAAIIAPVEDAVDGPRPCVVRDAGVGEA
jgi:hypothetical protein